MKYSNSKITLQKKRNLFSYLIIITILIFNINISYSNETINKVLEKMNLVKDFQAIMTLKIDISYLNAPEKSGTIYFKQPNKTKIDIEGFSMLPKQGTGNFLAEVLSKENTYITNGIENYSGKNCEVIKVIPNDPKSDVAIMTIWVDNSSYNVLKVESITKKSGSFTIGMKYTKIEQFYMPSEVKINFSVPEFSLPKTMTGDFKDNKENKPKSKDGKTEGTVIINYSNYKINKGISDKIFN